MLITQSKFDELFANNELKIAFIGMSNIGKTHWSDILASQKGFLSRSIDQEIQDQQGFKSWEEANEWMGYPFDAQYPETQKEYLALEESLTKASIPEGNFCIDTTGSVVHLSEEALKFLKDNFLVVSFDVSLSMLNPMISEFFRTPKTVVWGESFKPLDGEKSLDALRRCYPLLLKNRIQKYRDLSDVFIPGELSRSPELKVDRFWEILRMSLPSN